MDLWRVVCDFCHYCTEKRFLSHETDYCWLEGRRTASIELTYDRKRRQSRLFVRLSQQKNVLPMKNREFHLVHQLPVELQKMIEREREILLLSDWDRKTFSQTCHYFYKMIPQISLPLSLQISGQPIPIYYSMNLYS